MNLELERATNEALPWRQRMIFISGSLALDLAHTGGEGAAAAFERLHDSADLAHWLLISPLAWDAGGLVSAADVVAAKRLRRAVWSAANSVRIGEPADEASVSVLNEFARAASLAPQYVDGELRWDRHGRIDNAFSSISRDAISLLTDVARVPIQQCARADCPLLFIDRSRPGRRRWCSMDRCGTLAKTETFRRKSAGRRP